MFYRNPLKAIGLRRDGNVKPKIAGTIKEIEIHRRELENLRVKLEQRRKALFDTTVRAMMARDRSKATVYANEWAELRKVAKVVYASELALTQVVLRLESIVDVSDVMAHMSTAFKVLRKVSKTVQGLVPALDQASEEISNTLTETMAEMGNVSPTISLNIKTENGEELVEQARKYAEERAEEMKRNLHVSPRAITSATESPDMKVSILAGGEAGEEEESVLGILYGSPQRGDAGEQVLKYANIHNGSVDVTDASSVLSMPPDEVEHAMLKLISEGKVKISETRGKQE